MERNSGSFFPVFGVSNNSLGLVFTISSMIRNLKNALILDITLD
jgi:hypothetical protein